MRIIFLGLAFWNSIFFAVTICFGLMQDRVVHFTAGLITAIFTCLTHSIVMIHFMGTGKGIKEAVESYSLPNDPQTGYVRRTRQFKARTSGLATLAPILIIVTAWLGAAHDTGHMGVAWHAALALLAVAFNLYAFVVEYRVITENTAMLREINRRIAEKRV